jgi:hypothetical protein
MIAAIGFSIFENNNEKNKKQQTGWFRTAAGISSPVAVLVFGSRGDWSCKPVNRENKLEAQPAASHAHVYMVRLVLSRAVWVRVIQQILNAQQNLPNQKKQHATMRQPNHRACMGEAQTCLTVMLGFHPDSSFRILKQTVPDG